MECDLCVLKRRTNVYYETEWYTILDCDSCLVPMAVWKYHTMDIPKQGAFVMEEMLKEYGRQFYGDEEFFIDKSQRAILDHIHWHARKK